MGPSNGLTSPVPLYPEASLPSQPLNTPPFLQLLLRYGAKNCVFRKVTMLVCALAGGTGKQTNRQKEFFCTNKSLSFRVLAPTIFVFCQVEALIKGDLKANLPKW